MQDPQVEKAFGVTESHLPHRTHYCGGCGHGVAHRLICEVIDEMGLRERTVGVAPVGCAVTAYDYWNFDCSEAAHGRAPAVATGIKAVHPDHLVFTYQGDGDLASIGMGEIIHAANRGLPLTVIFINNANYGMTGGQLAPTTLPGMKTTTTPEGRKTETEGWPVDMCALVSALRAPRLVAREMLTAPRRVLKAKKLIRRAFKIQLKDRGFSFLEFLGACPTNWGLKPVESLGFIENEMQEYFEPKVYREPEG